MKRKLYFAVTILATSVCLISVTIAGQRDVLKAIEKVKANTETGVSYKKYVELLADAKFELNLLERNLKNPLKNNFFLEAYRSYISYDTAKMNWETKNNYGDSDGKLHNMIQENWTSAAKHLENAYKYRK